jgi:hypothetical protein
MPNSPGGSTKNIAGHKKGGANGSNYRQRTSAELSE